MALGQHRNLTPTQNSDVRHIGGLISEHLFEVLVSGEIRARSRDDVIFRVVALGRIVGRTLSEREFKIK